MDRSLAGRVVIGRSFDPGAPFAKALGFARAGFSLLARRRRLRLGLLAALLAVGALAGGWLLLRNSSLVSVERVHVSGVHGPEAAEIEAALGRAARHMSTLDVRTGALAAAVAPYRVVREVRATPSFPHGLRIDVVEQLPVAALTVAGGRTAVAADGVVLGPALLSSSLPLLKEGPTGSAAVLSVGTHVHGSSLLASLTLLGAAPAPLASAVARVYTGPQGVTAAMRKGLVVYFGNAALPHAKWLSLARVLADPSSAGAVYVDVRVPGRPAAGFAGAGPPEAGTTGLSPTTAATPASASDPTTAAELAAGLTSALGLSPGEQAAPIEESATAAPSEAPSGAPAQAGVATQAGASGGSESASATASEASATAPAAGG
jgi:cell division protein FtsQ